MKTKNKLLTPSYFFALITSSMAVILGVLVLIGWNIHNFTLVQILPHYVPMHYNTALGFFWAGTGILLASQNRKSLAKITGIFISGIGFLTLLQYLFSLNLGIDQLFMRSTMFEATTYSGRMAPNTAICLGLTGSAILLAGGTRPMKYRNIILGLLGLTIIALGLVATVGYLTKVQSAYGWGTYSPMAVHTAAGFIAIGLSLFTLALHRETQINFGRLPAWGGVSIGVLLAMFTIALWRAFMAELGAEHSALPDIFLLSGLFVSVLMVATIRSSRKAHTAVSELQATMQSLFESEEKFRNYFENSPIAKSITEINGSLNTNKAFCTMLGYTEEELKMKNWIEVTHPDDIQKTNEKIKPLLDGEQVKVRFQKRYFHKNGKIIYCDISTYLHRDRDGTPLYFITTANDITDYKVTEQEKDKLNRRLNSLWQLTGLQNEPLKEITNFVLQEMTKISESDYGFYGFINDDESQLTMFDWSEKALKECTIPNRPAVFEIEGAGIWANAVRSKKTFVINDYSSVSSAGPGLPDGHFPLIRFVAVPVFHNEKIVAVGAVANKAEDYSKADIQHLEYFLTNAHIIIHRRRDAEERDTALLAAESANRVKTLFLENISHEIRTPLYSIMGFSELIEESCKDKLNQQELEFFNLINMNINRLLTSIHGILDISQIDAGVYKPDPQVLNLEELVEDIAQSQEPVAARKGLQLHFEKKNQEYYIRADEHGLRMAIANLVDNAIKYTGTGFIRLELEYKNERYQLSISDSGIGIDSKFIDSIYDVFTQESSGYTKKYQGLGIGLALTRRYLDLNNVTLEVKSKKGSGTTFILSFPPMQGEPLPTANTASEPPGSAQIKKSMRKQPILLVEDDKHVQTLITYFLKDFVDLFIVESVEAAKETLRKNNVELVLLDLSLKGSEDGLDFVKYIRQNKTWRHLPVIAQTAHAFKMDKERCLAAGCNDYLAKPIKKDTLLRTINRLLRD